MRNDKNITATQYSEARAAIRSRMLGARDQVRGWFEPQFRARINPDVPEIVGPPSLPRVNRKRP